MENQKKARWKKIYIAELQHSNENELELEIFRITKIIFLSYFRK